MAISIQHIWLSGSLGLLFYWLFTFFFLVGGKESKKEMFVASLWTSLLGLIQPILVPEYWSPPTLFNLAQRAGFNIESFIFAFSIGGIVLAIYRAIFKTKHSPVRRLHYLFLLLAPLTFLLLHFFTNINPIYSVSIAMLAGALGVIICRRDLVKKALVGGAIFSGLYFIFFSGFNWAYPGYISRVWNFSAISGILILGVPIEELFFALTLGMFWSSLYEHIKWHKTKTV